MPQVMRENPGEDPPTFVSFEAAVDAAGLVRKELFTAGDARLVDGILRRTPASPAGCTPLWGPHLDTINAPSYRTLDDLSRLSVLAFEGVVTGTAPGLGFMGDIGTLVRLKVVEVFKGRLPDDSQEIFLFLQVARFSAFGRSFCRNEAGIERPPELREHVILLVYYEPFSTFELVAVPSMIVYLRQDGLAEFNGDLRAVLGSAKVDGAELRAILRRGENSSANRPE